MINYRQLILFCFIAVSIISCTKTETVLKVSPYVSDGMILQQSSQTRLWGKSTPGATVKAIVDWGCTFTATAKSDSIWEMMVVTPKADDKRHKITLSTDDEEVEISDILIGEIWIAAGEALIEFPLAGWLPDTVDGGMRAIREDEPDSLLRFFLADHQYSIKPMTDIDGRWVYDGVDRCGVSAISYYFARQLRDSLHIPVGVIVNTLGGTRAEAWITEDNMPKSAAGIYCQDWRKKMGEITKEVEKYDRWLVSHKHRTLKYGPNGEDPYIEVGGNKVNYRDETILMSDYDYSSWRTMTLPSKWSQTPLTSLQGICWYIKSDTLPQSWVGKDIEIHLGYIDDRDVTYFNGYEVGSHMQANQYGSNRVYRVKGSDIKTRDFTIAIRVINTGGDGGFKGCPDGRMRIELAKDKSKKPCYIDGEWAYRMTAIKRGNELYDMNLDIDEWNGHDKLTWYYDEKLPTVAANGMIIPFRQVATRGVIWYNCEHNESDADTTFRALNEANIKTFEKYLGSDISFYQIQAVPSMEAYMGEPNSTSILGVRKAQYETTKDKARRGTVSAIDLAWSGYHTPYKRPLGERLARMALSRTYGIEMKNDAGPEPVSMTSSSSLLLIRFKNHEGMSIDANSCQFEIAGDDGEFYIATTFIKGEEIAVFSHAVPHPKRVRYASRNMIEGTLKNGEGLPCVAFEMTLNE
ncbi:MAG: hypothetical protein Q4C30_03240 [Bacteroidia bacterium]|nr:hypothetical protein [Bacteroidia bacterium]